MKHDMKQTVTIIGPGRLCQHNFKHNRLSILVRIPQKSKETRGNAITQPRSNPSLNSIFLNGWDQGWVMPFPLASLLFLRCGV